MAKLRPAGKKRSSSSNMQRPGLVPCAIVILGGMALLSLLFYAALSSSGR